MLKRYKPNRQNLTSVYLASAAILVICIAAVLVVRAYLAARSEERVNQFAPMTYTNIEVNENYTPGTFDPTQQVDVTIPKDATIKNLSGKDKKPVYIRVKLITSIYDGRGRNVTLQYPDVAVNYDFDDWSDWEYIDDYYYYNHTVIPGGETSNLFSQFDSENHAFKIFYVNQLKEDMVVHVDVVADAVQAVSTDSSKWKASDYSTTEVSVAWPDVTATITPGGDTQTPIDVTWNPSSP